MILKHSGTWYSEMYSSAFCRGNVFVDLPDDFEAKWRSQDAQVNLVNARIKYLGLYRLRQEENLQIAFSGAKPTAGLTTPKFEHINGGKGTLEFEVDKIENSVISGRYKLSHPADFGKFEIKPGENNCNDCCVQ